MKSDKLLPSQAYGLEYAHAKRSGRGQLRRRGIVGISKHKNGEEHRSDGETGR